MRKTTNLPVDKNRLKAALMRRGLHQVEADKILGLKRGTIGNVMFYGSANPKIVEALEKVFGITYDDIRPIANEIKMDGSVLGLQAFVKKDDIGSVNDQVERPKPKQFASVHVDAEVLAEAVKEGMKQFWQECGNDILKRFEDVIFTGNYDARRKYTSQDLTYDLHRCWNTEKGYADLPEVQATLHRKR